MSPIMHPRSPNSGATRARELGARDRRQPSVRPSGRIEYDRFVFVSNDRARLR